MNPEFQRNLWLEFSPQRAVAMPLVLGAIFALAWFFAASNARFAGLMHAASIASVILLYLWGTRRAAAAVGEEVRAHTWDDQRLSGLGAWALTWGKLFGATAYIWYGGLICLGVMVSIALMHEGAGVAIRYDLDIVVDALSGQSVAFLVALILLRKQGARRRLPTTFCQAAGLLVIAIYYAQFVGVEVGSAFFDRAYVVWYEWRLPNWVFAFATKMIFLFWILLAAHRLMRDALQYRRFPWAWPLFSLYVMVWLAGLMIGLLAEAGYDGVFLWLAPVTLVAILLVYAALFAEPKDIVAQRSFLRPLLHGNLTRALRAMPLWIPGLFIALVLGLLLVSVTPNAVDLDDYFRLEVSLPHLRFDLAPYVVLAALIFLLRDVAFVLALNLGARPWRADLAALVYLLLLYGVCSALALALGMTWLVPFFMPFPGASAFHTLAPPAIQALLAWGWLAGRWRQGEIAASGPSSNPGAQRLE